MHTTAAGSGATAHLPSSSPPRVARKRSLGEKARACTRTLCSTKRQYSSFSSNFHTITSACKQEEQVSVRTRSPQRVGSVHLEAHVGALSGGEVGTAGGTGKAGDFVGVSLQE